MLKIKQSTKTLLDAMEILAEYDAIYNVLYVGTVGSTLLLFTNDGKQELHIPNIATKKELWNLIDPLRNQITININQ